LKAAGGAYAIDDADIGKPGSCQSEAWISNGVTHDSVGVASPVCVVMVGHPVEFSVLYQCGGQAKINNNTFAFSLSGGMFWDSATRTGSSFINTPLTFKYGRDFRIHANAGWFHDGRVGLDYAICGFGFDWDFLPSFQGLH
jgi:hypothetical protein